MQEGIIAFYLQVYLFLIKNSNKTSVNSRFNYEKLTFAADLINYSGGKK
ncbi:MAG: hypothetical protein JWO32_567 [Bacteroidetes bacterium]|nr:hypothetical protein [Bacteroidota bacterium]